MVVIFLLKGLAPDSFLALAVAAKFLALEMNPLDLVVKPTAPAVKPPLVLIFPVLVRMDLLLSLVLA